MGPVQYSLDGWQCSAETKENRVCIQTESRERKTHNTIYNEKNIHVEMLSKYVAYFFSVFTLMCIY